MQIVIDGVDLPGLSCGASPGFPGYTNIHVGVQRRNRPSEHLDLQPGDASSVAWALNCEVFRSEDMIDVRGPHVQGRPGGRFIYLSWLADCGAADDAAETLAMFRRAKLMLTDIDAEIIAGAEKSGRLTARLGLTDAKGHPICARIRPPTVQWTAG